MGKHTVSVSKVYLQYLVQSNPPENVCMDGDFCIHTENERYSMIFTPNGSAAALEKSSGEEFTAQGEEFQKVYRDLLKRV